MNAIRSAGFLPAIKRFAGWKPALLFLTAFAASASAQPGQRPAPRIGYVYPAGGKQGSTITVSVGGQNLNGASAVYFSGDGMHARVVGYDRPLTPKEINSLRERQGVLQEKRAGGKEPLTDAEKNELAAIREKLARRPNRLTSPALAETVTLEIMLSPNAQLGEHELRLKSNAGLTNPIVFCIGALPEIAEPVVTATMNPAPRKRETDPRSGRPKPTTTPITIPAVVNGQILPGEVDRFRFTAKQGQRLTVVARARALIPYLADAVPGWFQATLALYDSAGREVAYDDDFRFNPDPVLSYPIPADGEYAVEIKDSIYRGREDFVYRIAIGELPFVTAVFPLGATSGGRRTFEVTGWNLPETQVVLDTRDPRVRQLAFTLNRAGVPSNVVAVAIDAQPETLEHEPNDDAPPARLLALPVAINGRIARAGDADVFGFEGKAGAEIFAEVFARRLNSPLDSFLEISDAAGRRLASNDDHEDKGSGLTTHHADSRVRVKLPADGRYFVRVTDAQHRGGGEFGYRLQVGPPRPDFELRVTPATINARAGTHVPVTVYALRRDGFDGEIQLGLRNPPRGFALSGARIPAGQDKVQLTVFTPPAPRDEPYSLSLAGAATIDGKKVGRVAVPAEDMMQAFAYHHLVPAKEMLLQLTGRGGAARVVSSLPLQLAPGARARISVAAFIPPDVKTVHAELREPPAGVSVQQTVRTTQGLDVVVACDPAKAKPGAAGNLLLDIFAERGAPNAKTKAAVQRQPLATMPAVPFEVRAPATVAAK